MKPTTLPKLKAETEQFIEDHCSQFSIKRTRTLDGNEREIHYGFFIPKGSAYEAIYHVKNSCLPLLFLVRRITDYENDTIKRSHDLKTFSDTVKTISTNAQNSSGKTLTEPHGNTADPSNVHESEEIARGETSASEFASLAEAALKNHEENWNTLNKITRYASEVGDKNFTRHYDFAFKFAKDVDMNRLRRLAIVSLSSYSSLGRPMTLNELRDALLYWHNISADHSGIIRNDCKSLNIPYFTEKEKTNHQKKTLNTFLKSTNAEKLIRSALDSQNRNEQEKYAYQLLMKCLQSPEDKDLIDSALKLMVVPGNSSVDYLPISDELWKRIEPLLPLRTNTHPFGGGRPPTPDRVCLNGIFFILRTGRPWKALDRTGICPGSTAHERFDNWRKEGVFAKFREAGLMEHDDLKNLNWSLVG